jgi:hypothetical protein
MRSERTRGMTVFARLKSAYSSGGAPAFREVYLAAMEESSVNRAMAKLVDRICPVSHILDWSVRLDQLIAQHGLPKASAALFEELSVPLEVRIPAGEEHILRTAPLLLYGRHPSVLTPFTMAAALGRSDLRILVAGFLSNWFPASLPFVFPVFVAHRRMWHDVVGSRPSHALALAVLCGLDESPPPPVARARNRVMLSHVVNHVRAGGSSLIFPGGSAPRDRRWFPGIGVLAKELAETEAESPVYLAPFHVENDSNARSYGAISAGRVGSARGASRNQKPVLVRFERPVPVQNVITNSAASTAAVVTLLRQRYQSWSP